MDENRQSSQYRHKQVQIVENQLDYYNFANFAIFFAVVKSVENTFQRAF